MCDTAEDQSALARSKVDGTAPLGAGVSSLGTTASAASGGATTDATRTGEEPAGEESSSTAEATSAITSVLKKN